MISVYDTLNGMDYYKLHYSYSDAPHIGGVYAPLEFAEARELYYQYVRDTKYTNVYVTKENMVAETSNQVSSAALLKAVD